MRHRKAISQQNSHIVDGAQNWTFEISGDRASNRGGSIHPFIHPSWHPGRPLASEACWKSKLAKVYGHTYKLTWPEQQTEPGATPTLSNTHTQRRRGRGRGHGRKRGEGKD